MHWSVIATVVFVMVVLFPEKNENCHLSVSEILCICESSISLFYQHVLFLVSVVVDTSS
jgi:hypothetical protein